MAYVVLVLGLLGIESGLPDLGRELLQLRLDLAKLVGILVWLEVHLVDHK